ncbi:glycosyltransferase [Candidatus Peribacteria bacterium]|nr:glycosyltransferase [Candidatus Peribacteria bacterium]
MDKPVASIVLPTFNELENIVPLIEELQKYVDVPHEIIVVDDNSPDGTSKSVQDFINAHPGTTVRIETRMSDHGLQKSISRGIELAQGDIICWMDCDFSHPPETMAVLIRKAVSGCEIAVASRYVKGGSYKRGISWFNADESALGVILSRLINWFIHLALDSRFHDYTSGFIAIKATTLRSLTPLYGDYGEYFMDLMYRAIKNGHSFCEIPFISPPRRAGYSKTGTTFRQLFRRGKKYLPVIWHLWHL